MGCAFWLGIAQRERLRSVKNRAAILFWGVRQDTRRSKMTVPFERLGLRLLDCEVFFALHFSQPAGASFGWAWHRQRFFLRELTARYAPNARFASFGRDNRDYMARIARIVRRSCQHGMRENRDRWSFLPGLRVRVSRQGLGRSFLPPRLMEGSGPCYNRAISSAR